MSEREDILNNLKPLFEKARKEKLLFRSGYQGILFTPDELQKENGKGSFIWGPCNWTLENPIEELRSLERQVKNAQYNLDMFRAKMVKEGYDLEPPK